MCLFSLYFSNVTPLSSDLEHAIEVWWQSFFLSFLIWCPKGFFFLNLKINNFIRLCLDKGYSGKILPGMSFQYVVQISLSFFNFRKVFLNYNWSYLFFYVTLILTYSCLRAPLSIIYVFLKIVMNCITILVNDQLHIGLWSHLSFIHIKN